jgi:hypothetical protein
MTSCLLSLCPCSVQQFVIYLFLGVLFLAASSLVLYGLVAMHTELQHAWIPASTRHCILASTVCYIRYCDKT